MDYTNKSSIEVLIRKSFLLIALICWSHLLNGVDDNISGGAVPYTFLGTANYLGHEGSRPMNITWQLDKPIPAKFLKKTSKLVVG